MADDGREAVMASPKRSSPLADDDSDASIRGLSSDRIDSRMNIDIPLPHPGKRPRVTVSPTEPSRTASSTFNDDPYEFPGDGNVTRRGDSINQTLYKSHSPAEVSRDAQNMAKTEASVSPSPEAPSQTQPATQGHAIVDTVMGGTDESERPSIGEKKPPSAVPEPPLPPTPPPNVKTRQPHKLKRLREQHEREQEETEQQLRPKNALSEDKQARQELRRALVLALDHVGFSSATDDALESFLLMTETYFQSIAEDVARFALAGRRSQPIPLDFESSLPRFNLGTGALRPHLKNPVLPTKLAPPEQSNDGQQRLQKLSLFGSSPDNSSCNDLPLLSSELSGKSEKDEKTYIPSGFPDFPSIHTYRHTPVDVDSVTVMGNGLRYDDGSLLLLPNEEPSADDRELGLGGTGAGARGASNKTTISDPKRIREAAAVEAKQAEEALRGLMRASKVNKLKEVRAAADRNALNKKRYTLWEAAMQELIVDAKQKKGGSAGGRPSLALGSTSQGLDASPSKGAKGASAAAAAALREEIADQSMMVNAEKAYHRKEVPRKTHQVAYGWERHGT